MNHPGRGKLFKIGAWTLGDEWMDLRLQVSVRVDVYSSIDFGLGVFN